MQVSLAQALEDLHTRIAAAVLALDDDALYWQPIPGRDSINDLVRRVAAEEYHWIGEPVAGCHIAPRCGASAEAGGLGMMPGRSGEHPLFRLGSAGQVSQVVLGSLAPTEWIVERQVDGQSVTTAGCTLHVLEALALCLGQIELIARLWEARSGESNP